MRMKKNDKGFTLLELLIAVVILAIIIVPLLRGFVSSHQVNAKSRHLMRATTLAQNEMEIFEKEKLADLVADAALPDPKFGYSVVTEPDETDPDDPGLYEFKREGIINDETGRDMFDVYVRLNPERAASGDLYYDQNKGCELLSMNTVSGLDSATYIQRVRNQVNETGDDEKVYKVYQTRQLPDGVTGASWTSEMFGQELTRTITLTIDQVNQGGVMATVAKIRYDYKTNYDNVPDEFRDYTTKDRIFFNNAQTLDAEGNPVPLKSVYLYYAPRYNDSTQAGIVGKTISDDEIIIDNKAELPVNVYIMRQNIHEKTWLPSEGDDKKIIGVYVDGVLGLQNTVPNNYQVNVTINDSIGADNMTHGRYFTNLRLSDDDYPVGKTAKFTLNGAVVFGNALIDATGMQSLNPKRRADGSFGEPGSGSAGDMTVLGSSEAMDRIYTMETVVYNHGDNPSDPSTEPVVRLTGTKIE